MTAPGNAAVPMTAGETLLWSALINACIGLAVGLIPLVIGIVKAHKKYGLMGFLYSIAGGAILGSFLAVPLGLLLSVPCAVVFTWLILRDSRGKTGDSQP